MSQLHLVRYGALGQIGCFSSSDAVCYPRAAPVVCRTPRGLEVGEVLTRDLPQHTTAEGTLLRRVTAQDQLLLARLEQNRDEAFAACVELLQKRNLPQVLVDVEALFDGQSLILYFLSEITPELEAVTDEMAAAFEAKVQLRRFAETLSAGCGPDCGAEAAGGCSSGGCSSCAVAQACQK